MKGNWRNKQLDEQANRQRTKERARRDAFNRIGLVRTCICGRKVLRNKKRVILRRPEVKLKSERETVFTVQPNEIDGRKACKCKGQIARSNETGSNDFSGI
jgi:hypothetical protein